MARHFLKGFLIGLFCICLFGLVWFLLIQPGITNGEAKMLKMEYADSGPGAIGSGASPTEEKQLVDLAALQADYPDIQGWFTIPGTCVDYPILQSSEEQPEYYLRRTYKGEWRTAGSLFFQWDCTPQSRNLVIFGHNMNDGTMFGSLPKMLDNAYRAEHTEILLQTAAGQECYTVVAVLKTDTAHLAFNRTAFVDEEDFLSFERRILEASAYLSSYAPRGNEQLLTLVTCSYEWEGARTVVVAVRN